MFDWTKPTTQMLGRWQPWHDGDKSVLAERLMKLFLAEARRRGETNG